jgi:gliding motility-associated-like protein
MTKFNKALALIATLFIMLSSRDTFASHLQGADVTYQCLGNGFYKVRFTVYRDCSGILVFPITCDITSTCGLPTTIPTHQVNDPLTGLDHIEISKALLCPGVVSTCSGGTVPGIWQYTFETDSFQVDPNCEFTASASQNARNSNTNSNGGGSLYVESKFYSDSAQGACNQSPVFYSPPVPYFCVGQPISYSQAAFDFDGDSLVYSLVAPLTGPGSPLAFTAPATFSNPMAGKTIGPFNFNTATGEISFVPSTQGKYTLAVQVTEYRNGKKIGTTLRDIQIIILNCSGNLPVVSSTIGGDALNPRRVTACPGTNIDFTMYIVQGDSGVNVNLDSASSNFPGVLANFPGATMTFTHLHPLAGGLFSYDTLVAHFLWTPPASSYGNYSIPLTVINDNCLHGGLFPGRQTYNILIKVIKAMDAGPDQVYCIGGAPIQLCVTNTTQQLWSDISGGPPKDLYLGPITSKCISVTPSLLPNQSDTYVVSTNTPGACRTKDTVIVTGATLFALSASATDSSICKYAKTTVTATTPDLSLAPYTFSWQPATTFVAPTSRTTQTNPVANSGFVYVTATSSQGCSVTNSVPISLSGVAPKVLIVASANNVCPGDTVALFAQTVLESLVPCGPTPGVFANLCPSGSVYGNADIGVGATSVITGGVPSPFKHNANSRMQILYTATELQAAGLSSGTITDIAILVQLQETGLYSNYAVKLGCTNLTKLPNVFVPGLTKVYQSTAGIGAFQSSAGWSNFNFNVSPYDWDGVSNLIVELVYSGYASANGQDDSVSAAASLFNSSICVANSATTPGTSLTTGALSATRPSLRFSNCSPGVVTYKWTPSPIDDDTLQRVTAGVKNDITYHLHAVNGVCAADTSINMKINAATLIKLRDTTVCGDSAQLRIFYPNYVVPSCVTDYNVDSMNYGPIAGTQTIIADTEFVLSTGQRRREAQNSGIAGPFNIGFPFQFYCDTFTQFWVSPNGWITFKDPYTTTSVADQPAQQLPLTPYEPLKLVALYWTDLATQNYLYGPPLAQVSGGCGNIGYFLTGTAPNQILVVKYNGLCYAKESGTSETMSGEIHLYQKDGHVELMVDSSNIASGNVRTTGLKFEPGKGVAAPKRNRVLDYVYSGLGNPHGRESWKFTPQYTGAIPVSFLWTPALGLTSAAIDTPKAFPPSTQLYHVQVTYQNGCKVNDSVKVTIGSFPHTLVALPSNKVCPGANPTLVLQDTGGVSYQWQPSLLCANPNADSTKVFVTDTTKFFVTATNTQGCKIKDSITIYTLKTPNVTVKPDKVVCSTDSVTLQSPGTYLTYTWTKLDTAKGRFDSVASTVTYQGKPSNKYQLIVKDINSSCPAYSDTVTVTAFAPTILTVIDSAHPIPISVCAPATITLHALPKGSLTNIQWSPVSLGTSSSAQVSQSGTYSFTARDVNGCLYSSNKAPVLVNATPNITITPSNPIICGTGKDTLTAHITGLYDQYFWALSPIVNDTIYVASDSGLYSFVASYKGCSRFDSVRVKKFANPIVNLGSDVDTCLCGYQVDIIPNLTGGYTYLWTTPIKDSVANSFTITKDNSGTYSLTVTDNNGCKGSDTVSVNIHCLTVKGLAAKDSILQGQSTLLTNTTSYSSANLVYQWTPADSLLTPSLTSTYLDSVKLQSGVKVFVIQVTDPVFHCIAKDTIVLYILTGGGDTMASAFTPNGDGVNDNLYPALKGGSSSQVTTFRVFNRWGQIVHDSTTPWSGDYSGLNQPVGTYFYFLQITSVDPNNPSQNTTKSYQGSVELIR